MGLRDFKALFDYAEKLMDPEAVAALRGEFDRLVAAEMRIKQLCLGVERDAVGGGVRVGEVNTGAVREAFGWPAAPVPLSVRMPLSYYSVGQKVTVFWQEKWQPGQVASYASAGGIMVRLYADWEPAFSSAAHGPEVLVVAPEFLGRWVHDGKIVKAGD